MKKVNEANMNISVNGESAAEVSELLRIMQLAGADAKEVSIDDINPRPKPMPMPSPGGCGGGEPSMADTIKMISKEEDDYDGDFGDATTEPDAEYMRSNAGDVSDMIPSGDDLHKDKASYPATAGGDNPMNTKESIHAMLAKALAEKNAKPDYIDIDGDGNKEEPMKKAAKDKKSKGIQAMIDAGNAKADAEADDEDVAEYDVPSNFENKHKDINNLGRKMMDMSSNMSGTDDTSLMMANALSRLGEVLAEFGGSGFAANNMADVIKKSSLNKEIVQMLMKKAKEDSNSNESVYEATEKMPSKAEVMKCCKEGMSKADCCKKYPDCDHTKLKEMYESCMSEMKDK